MQSAGDSDESVKAAAAARITAVAFGSRGRPIEQRRLEGIALAGQLGGFRRPGDAITRDRLPDLVGALRQPSAFGPARWASIALGQTKPAARRCSRSARGRGQARQLAARGSRLQDQVT
jgi:hypothetical protein